MAILFPSKKIKDKQIMIQSIPTNNATSTTGNTIVQEAIRFLASQSLPQRWVCELCGMVHSGEQPQTCSSCFSPLALVQQPEIHRELHNRF